MPFEEEEEDVAIYRRRWSLFESNCFAAKRKILEFGAMFPKVTFISKSKGLKVWMLLCHLSRIAYFSSFVVGKLDKEPGFYWQELNTKMPKIQKP